MSRLRVWPLMLIGILVVSRAAAGQVAVVSSSGQPDDSTDKSPAFSVRKEQRPIVDAFEDFERYRDKKAWEKAFTSLSKIEDGKPGRLVPDKDGFLVPTELKIRAELLSLPPEGREAYRLFNDAKARQLLADLTPADGVSAGDEIASLSKLVNRYFITAIGDQAADRLGDAFFETGDFANAQRCWQMVVENYPDSSLPAVQLQTKRAIALARAGEWGQFETVRLLLHDRYTGQNARIGGKDLPAVDFVDKLKPDHAPAIQNPVDSSGLALSTFPVHVVGDEPLLPTSDHPAWQIPLMDTQACAQLTGALGQNGWAAMAGQFTDSVPATAVDQHRVYVNWLGICFALDLKSGKLIWRSDTFADMPQKMAQSLMQAISIDPATYSTVVSGDNVLFSKRNTDNQDYNQMPMTRLTCVAGATGKAVWKSEQSSLAGWGFVGQPMLKGDVFYILAHANNAQVLSLLCIGVARADIRWTCELGTPAASTNWRGQPSVPMPTLAQSGGKIYVLTNNGALLQVDMSSHQVDWALGYPTTIPPQQQYWGTAQPALIVSPGAILSTGSTLYIKEYNSNLLFAIDPSGPTLKWKRRIDAEEGVVSFDGRNLVLAGPDIECLDLDTRTLKWDAKTTMRSSTVQPLVQGDWIYLFGCRGIDSIRLSTGETGPHFRGYDRDCDGGVLWKTADRLVTVSSRAITAYPLPAK